MSNQIVPTQEQLDIIQAAVQGKSLRIQASAGASKSTTLMMVAEKMVVPTLYIVFNKRMQEEANERFPGWVEVRTTHSLAYQAIGHKYRDKLKRPVGRYQNVCGTASEVARFFKISPIEYKKDKWITSAAIGYSVLATVRKFEHSAEKEITKDLVSSYALQDKNKDDVKHIRQKYKDTVLKAAKELWLLRTNLKSPVLAEHDTYLKLYQLSEPDLSHYEMIMIDEAQDSNECVIDFLKDQQVQTLVVGDEKQAIYQFRGSMNALKEFNFQTMTLSKSFRYGPEVAKVARAITGVEKMFGWEKLDTKVVGSEDNFKMPDTYTAIFRTNSAMLQDAIVRISEGRKVNIESNLRDFIQLIESALSLQAGDMKKVKHHSLLVYEDWGGLKKDVEWVQGELQRVVKMIESRSVYHTLGVLKAHRNVSEPEIIYSTAHKMKGLEADNVVLGDDFMGIYNKDGELRKIPEAESNLLYVAATRAKKLLVLNSQVEEIVALSQPLGGCEAY